MTTWTLTQMASWTTKDPRVRVADFGRQNWRTMVIDEPGSADWSVTGPPHPTKLAAYAAVDDVLADYFGELPTRAQLTERIEAALAIAREGSTYRKVDRMVAALGGLAEPHAAADVIHEDELEISVTRPGAQRGGLTTGEFDPYVCITHKPTGITVVRDSERSQLQNKAAALIELRRQLEGRTL